MANWKTTTNYYETDQRSISGKFELIEAREIMKVEASCGCSTPSFNDKEINYVVTLNEPKHSVPKQLYDAGKTSYDKTVQLNVFFKDNPIEFDELFVKIKVNEHKSVKLSDKS